MYSSLHGLLLRRCCGDGCHVRLALRARAVRYLNGDCGYISQALHGVLYSQGIALLPKIRKSMKNRLMRLWDKLLLRKRILSETINDPLKHVSQIELTCHRSVKGFMVNVVAV
jgi:hypothetical protein